MTKFKRQSRNSINKSLSASVLLKHYIKTVNENKPKIVRVWTDVDENAKPKKLSDSAESTIYIFENIDEKEKIINEKR